jgi:hypothetical protein
MSQTAHLVDRNFINRVMPLLSLDARKLGTVTDSKERKKMIARAIYKQIRKKEVDKQVALETLRTLLHLKPQELLNV